MRLVCQPAFLSGVGVIGDHEVTPGKCRLDVDLGGSGGLARTVHGLARPQQRLRGDARPVGALTAHEFALHNGHAQTTLRERPRAVLAGRTAAEHDHVIVAAHQRPGSRVVISWSSQPLPSGSLKVANEP